MRAGCFAETRVINLLNRRFVPFYYNTDQGPKGAGAGGGQDPDAKAFTKGKTQNKWAFFAAFSADGEPLGVTDVYGNKDAVFEFLVELLNANPDLAKLTSEEEALLARAKAEPQNASAQLDAGRLLEDLGRYKEAEPFFRGMIALPDNAATAEAFRGLLRMARYGRQWDKLHALGKEIEGRPDASKLSLGADLAMERGYYLRAQRKFSELRTLLEAAIKENPQTKRLSELHFYAGIACYFLKDKDHAYYHWCWIVENLPDDRMVRRAFITAAHEGMPYRNPELDNFAADLHGGQIEVINGAYEAAKQVYLRIKQKEGSE